MRMKEAGLMDFWYREGLPDVHQCLDSKKNNFADHRNVSALNLKNLTGAFSVLVIGTLLSAIVFAIENCRRIFSNANSRQG